MNEVLFLGTALVAMSLVLVALRLGAQWVTGLVITFLLIANVFASKLSPVFGITSSLAIPLYAAIFLATDAVSEHFGKKRAFRLVGIGFLAQACLVLFAQVLIRASSVEFEPASTYSTALSTIFNAVPRIVLGSFVAYAVSQTLDILIFHHFHEKHGGRRIWLRNCLSTTVSQGVDTVIFLFIAFYGMPGFYQFMIFVWILKVGVALFDTPFLYLTYKVLGKPLPSQNE